MLDNPTAIAQALQHNERLCADELYLSLGECTLRLRSNSAALVANLRSYFAHVVAQAAEPNIDVLAIEREAPQLGLDFHDWKREAGTTRAIGIPKLPRINPGTIVHNPKLHALIPAQQRASLLQLPPQKLWELEDKYDVQIEPVYGAGRIVPEAPLAAFLVLNWQRDNDAKLRVEAVDLAERTDLLGAIMKSPGPFYQYSDGSFYQDSTEFDAHAHLDALNGVSVYEAKGGVDFAALIDRCRDELMV